LLILGLAPIAPQATIGHVVSLVTNQRVGSIEAAENIVTCDPEYHVRPVVAGERVGRVGAYDIFEACKRVPIGIGVVAQVDR